MLTIQRSVDLNRSRKGLTGAEESVSLLKLFKVDKV